MQLVFRPFSDYLPAPQFVQPSVFDVAAILVEYCPAGHSCVVQLVFTPDAA